MLVGVSMKGTWIGIFFFSFGVQNDFHPHGARWLGTCPLEATKKEKQKKWLAQVCAFCKCHVSRHVKTFCVVSALSGMFWSRNNDSIWFSMDRHHIVRYLRCGVKVNTNWSHDFWPWGPARWGPAESWWQNRAVQWWCLLVVQLLPSSRPFSSARTVLWCGTEYNPSCRSMHTHTAVFLCVWCFFSMVIWYIGIHSAHEHYVVHGWEMVLHSL